MNVHMVSVHTSST